MNIYKYKRVGIYAILSFTLDLSKDRSIYLNQPNNNYKGHSELEQ